MKKIAFLILSILFVSCGTTVSYDYDKQTNFLQYQRYNYFPNIESGLNELDDKRIVFITDSLLQRRGFVKSETPQFLINFYAKEYVSNSRNTIGIGIGSGGGNIGVGLSGGIPIGGRVINQQLAIDFIDVTKDDLFWQAITEGELKEKATPIQKEAHYKKLLSKILKGFPPKK